mgnify:CR=1 FL=1
MKKQSNTSLQAKTLACHREAGLIGLHLVEHLLKLDQKVVGLDNFANGKRKNQPGKGCRQRRPMAKTQIYREKEALHRGLF